MLKRASLAGIESELQLAEQADKQRQDTSVKQQRAMAAARKAD